MTRPTSLSKTVLAIAGTVLLAAPAVARADDTAPLRLTVPAAASAEPAASFLVAGLAPTAAQASSGGGSPRHQGVGVGVKGGFLFNNFKESHTDFKNNGGWLFGVFFGGNRPGVVGVMGEVMYAKKGAKLAGSTTDLYYLEIPILARVNIGSSSLNGVNVYVIGGPAFDINLKAKQDDLDVKDNYESLDIGAIAGGGIEITRFLVEARYNWGLRNVLKSSGAGSITDIKTRSFAVMAGVRFN